jgi:hypothetical protein
LVVVVAVAAVVDMVVGAMAYASFSSYDMVALV